ncbi:3832_t:CDS:2, partial [Funneliformis caledonium]
ICDKDTLTLNDELEINEEILNDKEEINVKKVESESSDDDDEILPEDSKANGN